MADSDWKFEIEDFDFEEDDGLEPGSPSAEGILFVILGAVATVASFAAMFFL